jgi:hypothetical protein
MIKLLSFTPSALPASTEVRGTGEVSAKQPMARAEPLDRLEAGSGGSGWTAAPTLDPSSQNGAVIGALGRRAGAAFELGPDEPTGEPANPAGIPPDPVGPDGPEGPTGEIIEHPDPRPVNPDPPDGPMGIPDPDPRPIVPEDDARPHTPFGIPDDRDRTME